MVKVPLVVSTAPERIWLQVADDSYSATEAFPDDHAEITWCQDSVLATEVKYVRADLYEALAERCERLEAALREAKEEIIWWQKEHSCCPIDRELMGKIDEALRGVQGDSK